MSTYEKITLIIIIVLLIVMGGWSYHELEEQLYKAIFLNEESDFDRSIGTEFKMGVFTNIVATSSSETVEDECDILEPVFVSVLHDIKERLEDDLEDFNFSLNEKEDEFEVNKKILDFFCHTTASVTLSSDGGDRLLLSKIPFSRGVASYGIYTDGIGTRIHIDATVITQGDTLIPDEPTIFGDILIPDKYLDVI